MKNTFEVLGSIQQNQTQTSRISVCKAQKTGVGLPPWALAVLGPLPPSYWQFSSFQSGLLVVRGRLTPCPDYSWHSVNAYWLDGHVRTLSLEPSLYPNPAMRPPTLKKVLYVAAVVVACASPASLLLHSLLPPVSFPASALLPIPGICCTLLLSRVLNVQKRKQKTKTPQCPEAPGK